MLTLNIRQIPESETLSSKALGLLGLCLIGFQSSPIFWAIGYAITLGLLSIINSINHTFWQFLSPADLQGTIFGLDE